MNSKNNDSYVFMYADIIYTKVINLDDDAYIITCDLFEKNTSPYLVYIRKTTEQCFLKVKEG